MHFWSWHIRLLPHFVPSSTKPGLLVSTAPGCVVKDLKIVKKEGVNYEGRVKSSEVGGRGGVGGGGKNF